MGGLQKIPQYLSLNIVQLRKARGLSQDQLAKLAEIPRSTLTNIESGAGNPSLQNLVRISAALQVGIEELLSRPRNEVELITEDRVPVEKRSQGRVKMYQLTPEKVKGLDVDRMEMEIGSTMGGHPHLKGAKEYFSVIQGEVTLMIAGETYRVRRGDVLAFPGDQPHSYRNTGESKVVAISVVVPITLGID